MSQLVTAKNILASSSLSKRTSKASFRSGPNDLTLTIEPSLGWVFLFLSGAFVYGYLMSEKKNIIFQQPENLVKRLAIIRLPGLPPWPLFVFRLNRRTCPKTANMTAGFPKCMYLDMNANIHVTSPCSVSLPIYNKSVESISCKCIYYIWYQYIYIYFNNIIQDWLQYGLTLPYTSFVIILNMFMTIIKPLWASAQASVANNTSDKFPCQPWQVRNIRHRILP